MKHCIISALLILIPSLAFSATIQVPLDHATIQGAIDAASGGDTVLVAPGTYVENITFSGKAITVKSSDGAEATVINGNQTGSCVRFQNGEGHGSILDGFTLTNGNGTQGLGGAFYGGGIFCYDHSSPTILNNIIKGNEGFSGGGIYCYSYCSPVINFNEVADNSSGNGGGIYFYHWCNPTLEGNIIHNNSSGMGGGIYAYTSSPLIINNIVFDNYASYEGGGFFCYEYCNPVIRNSTFYNNEAVDNGGGMSCTCYSTVKVSNSVFWNNECPSGKEISIGSQSWGSTLTIDYCIVDGGTASTYIDPKASLSWGSVMIDSDPLFIDPDLGDLHIKFNSPCKDAGNNGDATGLHDFEGDPRISGGTVDMGADEFYPHLYITGDKTSGGAIQLKLIGNPSSNPVAYFFGTDTWDPPLNWWPYGSWYLKSPAVGPYIIADIPSPDGVHVLGGNIPVMPPGPYTIYFHGLIGSTATNLAVLIVQ